MPVQDDVAPTGAGPVTLRSGADLGCTLVCCLTGDLDIESLSPAQQALDEAIRTGPRILVVDLEQVGFCDSSGLNLLLKVRAAALEADIGLRLAAASPPVLRLLEITCTQTLFELHPTVRAALAEAP
ncbi:STAS domain-containing protein [Kitasatospora sp. NPDC002040]|uniref:STAS domain-containing protein n=1 Tax=Kitasatospora sp. NPDC002040 TaxID=3154661 RepID=UPI0033248248